MAKRTVTRKKKITVKAEILPPIEEVRAEFRKLRDNASYEVSKQTWMVEVEKIAKAVRDKPSPEEWLAAAHKAKVPCPRCKGTATYSWGACENGRMTHSGPCFRCQGTGRQGQEDFTRNQYYDKHALAKAFN